MKQFTTKVYYPYTPIGFEYELVSVQDTIARLVWLEELYGVAHLQSRYTRQEETNTALNPTMGLSGVNRLNEYFPQGRANGSDVDLSFDDTKASRAFFFIGKDLINVTPKTDPQGFTHDNVEIAQPFSLILTANLDKLEIASYEVLKTGLLYELNRCRRLSIVSMCEGFDDVWKEFTVTHRMGSITRFPNYCLRIECVLTYMAFPFNGNDQYNPKNDDTNYTPQISFMDAVNLMLAQMRAVLTVGVVTANTINNPFFLKTIVSIQTAEQTYIAGVDFTQESDGSGNPTGNITGINVEFFTGQTILVNR